MGKVEDAVASMYNNPDELKDIVLVPDEIYFMFRGHRFSVQRRTGNWDKDEYWFYVYPKKSYSTTDALISDLNASTDDPSLQVPMIEYEGVKYSSRLFTILREKFYKVDDIFDSVADDKDDDSEQDIPF